MAVTLDYALRLKTKEAENNARLTKEEVRKLKEELAETRREAQQTERAMRQVGGSVSRLGRLSGRLGGSMGRVSGILGRLSPGLAEAAMVTSDLADATELATAGGASLLRILGPVAIAAAAVGAAYLVLNAQLKEAEERQAAAAATAERAAVAHLKLKAGIADVNTQAALLNGTIDQFEVDRIQSVKALQEAGQEQIEIQGALIRAAREDVAEKAKALEITQRNFRLDIERAKEAEKTGGKATFMQRNALSAMRSNQQALDEANARLAVQQANLQGVNDTLAENESLLGDIAEHHRETAVAAEAEAQARRDTTAATRAAARAKKADAEAEKARIQAISEQRGQDRLKRIQRELSAAGTAIDEAFDTTAIESSWAEVIVLMEDATKAQMRLEGIQKAGSVLGTGGDPLALLSLAGPGGAAVGAGLGGLASLGGKDDEELDAMFSGLGEDIIAGRSQAAPGDCRAPPRPRDHARHPAPPGDWQRPSHRRCGPCSTASSPGVRSAGIGVRPGALPAATATASSTASATCSGETSSDGRAAARAAPSPVTGCTCSTRARRSCAAPGSAVEMVRRRCSRSCSTCACTPRECCRPSSRCRS